MHQSPSCGFYGGSTSFSILFPMPSKQSIDEASYANPTTPSSSSSVDCTLSLRTPSTHQTTIEAIGNKPTTSSPVIHQYSSCMSSLCWDIKSQSNKHPSTAAAGVGSNNLNLGGDPLLARRCGNCDTTSTPLWRNGPRGPKSLCNACGIRYKKVERRSAIAMVADPDQVVGYGSYRRQLKNSWSILFTGSGEFTGHRRA